MCDSRQTLLGTIAGKQILTILNTMGLTQ